MFAAAAALACVGLGAGQARAEAPSCAATAERHVVVDQDIGPVTVATDFDLAAIAAMATRLGASFARPPEGFYLGKFAATVTVDPAEAPETCDAPIAIHVTLHLTGRVIEIGRDLLSQPCRQAAAGGAERRQHAGRPRPPGRSLLGMMKPSPHPVVSRVHADG